MCFAGSINPGPYTPWAPGAWDCSPSVTSRMLIHEVTQQATEQKLDIAKKRLYFPAVKGFG